MSNPRIIARVISIGTAAALLSAARISAQGTKQGPLNGELLSSGVDTLSVTVEQAGQVIPVASAVQTLKRVKRGKDDAWEQVYRWYGKDGETSADTLWYDANTLRPIENHRHNSAHDAVTVFGASSAHTVLTPRGGTPEVTDTTIVGPLYASGTLEAIIRTSPLGPGYSARYNLHYGGPLGVRSGPFRVARSETVSTLGGEAVECWVVDAEPGGTLNTFWIAKKNRKLIKLVNHDDPSAAFVFRR